MYSEPDGGGACADDVATDGGSAGDASGDPGLGRRILLAVGGIVVVLSGGIGWIVGSNGALEVAAVLGTGFTIPVTPATVALYGVVVSTTILGVLFGLVELASRLEADRSGPE